MKIHMVKKGDTLYLIAQKYNVSLEDVLKANPEIENPDVIDVGMKVKIPGPPMPALLHQHIVQQGDTLWKLSKAWGIPLEEMIKANKQLKNPNVLLTGEVVNIPKLAPAGEHHDMTGGQHHDVNHHESHHGKANTGVMHVGTEKPSTSVKPSTEAIPEVPAPLPVPTPLPVAPIAPVPYPITHVAPIAAEPYPVTHVAPIAAEPYPVAPISPISNVPMPIHHTPSYGYGVQENVDLFKQFHMPAVEATAPIASPVYPYPMPVSPISKAGHDYGHYGHTPVVSPAVSPVEEECYEYVPGIGSLPGLPIAPIGTIPGLPVAPIGSIPGLPVSPIGTLPGLPTTPIGTLPGYPMAPIGTLPGLPMAPIGTIPGLPIAPIGGIPNMPISPIGTLPGLPISPIGTLPGFPVYAAPVKHGCKPCQAPTPVWPTPIAANPLAVSPTAVAPTGIGPDGFYGGGFGSNVAAANVHAAHAHYPYGAPTGVSPLAASPVEYPYYSDQHALSSSNDDYDQKEPRVHASEEEDPLEPTKKRIAVKSKSKSSAPRQPKPKRRESLPWIKS